MAHQTHENYSRQEDAVRGSDRSFGMVIAAALALLTLINIWHSGRVWPWTGALATLFFIFACLFPTALKPLNWTWFKFGLLLHKVVNPVVMGVLFFGSVLPTSLIMRAAGKDLLRLRRNTEADSYWVVREPPGPAPETMKDQF